MAAAADSTLKQLREAIRGQEVPVFVTLGVAWLILRWMAPKKFEADEHVEPEPVEVKPVEKRDYTAQELLEFDGTDLSKAVLVVIKENIFDVTGRRDLYGPEGPYGVFAGKDASRMLGKMQTRPDDQDPRIDDLTPEEQTCLENWEAYFLAKYEIIGKVKA